jgi:uncharacterized protein (TIGR03067 family)
MHKRLPTLVLACLALAFAPAPFPKPDSNKDALAKLQGVWMPVAITLESGSPPAAFPWDRMEITKEQMTYFRNGGVVSQWKVTLDARKSPKVIDCQGAGGNHGALYQGVYRLKGDTLTICSAQVANGGRPARVTPSRSGQMLEVFQRGKR